MPSNLAEPAMAAKQLPLWAEAPEAAESLPVPESAPVESAPNWDGVFSLLAALTSMPQTEQAIVDGLFEQFGLDKEKVMAEHKAGRQRVQTPREPRGRAGATGPAQATKTIEPDLLPILSGMTFDGNLARLPGKQLERRTYERVNEVLAALGGKWSKRQKAHVFESEAEPLILDALTVGAFTDVKKLYQFYETPVAVVARVIELAEIAPGLTVLEPSAGRGALARLARDAGATVKCVELQIAHAEQLEREGFQASRGDFLSFTYLGGRNHFDRVVMNPPFSGGQDIQHVQHAATQFLKPGGILVSVMAVGWQSREDRRAREFRAWLASLQHEIHRLPEDAFKESGTGVNTLILKVWA